MMLTSPQPLEPFCQDRKGVMVSFARIRIVLFGISLLAVLFSTALVPLSYLRLNIPNDYLRQVYELGRWIGWGFIAAVVGLILGAFGTSWRRIVVMLLSAILAAHWYVVGVSLP